jgi:hypothetical protein
VYKVLLAPMVYKVYKVFRELKDSKELRDCKVFRVQVMVV